MRTFAAVSFAVVAGAAIMCGSAFGQSSPASAPTERKADQAAAARGRHGNRARLLSEYAHEKAAEKEKTKEKTADAKRDKVKKLAASNGDKPEIGGGRLPYGSAGTKAGTSAFWKRAKERFAKGSMTPNPFDKHLGAAGLKGMSKAAIGVLGHSAHGSKKEGARLSYSDGTATYSGKTGYTTGLTSGGGYLAGMGKSSPAKNSKKTQDQTQNSYQSASKEKKAGGKGEDKDKAGTKDSSQKP